MRGDDEEQGGSSGSYYKLTKLDHLLASWEPLVILDRVATYRKDRHVSIQYVTTLLFFLFILLP